MTRTDLIERVATQTGLPKESVQEVLEKMAIAISMGLSDGEKVKLRGFGTFSPTEIPARLGRDFKGKKIKIKRTVSVSFKPSIEMKEVLNG